MDQETHLELGNKHKYTTLLKNKIDLHLRYLNIYFEILPIFI